jgi:hypothetical protein
MKWFKHKTGERNSPGLKRAEKLAGETAYGRYFKLFEVMADSCGSGERFDPRIDLSRPPQDLEWLADALSISADELEKTLGVFAGLGLIDPDAWGRKVVSLPALKEQADEWTGRYLRNSGVAPEKLQRNSDKMRGEESRTEKKREKKERIAHAALAPSLEFAIKAFEEKLGQRPTWTKRDFVQLTSLFNRRPELTLAEFSRRFRNYLESTEQFIAKQGWGLNWFCCKFDSFLAGPIHDRGAVPFKKSAAQQAREDERRRQEVSPEGQALLQRFGGES